MKTSFRKSFARDLKKIKVAEVRAAIRSAITSVESATDLRQLNELKKIVGTDNCYRLRIGDYRIGIIIERDVVEFVRCLHRRDLYRHFP